jgi:hypothetical protein
MRNPVPVFRISYLLRQSGTALKMWIPPANEMHQRRDISFSRLRVGKSQFPVCVGLQRITD